MAPVDTIADLEGQVTDVMSRHRIPGLAAAWIEDGRLQWCRAFGVTACLEGSPLTTRTLFRIGSVTKPLVATTVMRLVERGVLGLDRPIVDWLPELREPQRARAGQLTLGMLLSHRAGLPLLEEEHGPVDASQVRAWWMDRVSRVGWVAPPARVFSYSNGGPSLAACVVEAAVGRPFAAVMDEELFRPLGMLRSTFELQAAATWPLAQAHASTVDGSPQVQHWVLENAALRPAGFLWSSLEDLAAFALAHVSGGVGPSGQLLSAQSLATMHQPSVDLLLPGGEAHGIGFFCRVDSGQLRVWHEGDIGGYSSALIMAPQQGRALVLMSNFSPPGLGYHDFCDRLFETLGGSRGPPSPTATAVASSGPLPEGRCGWFDGPMGPLCFLNSQQGPLLQLGEEVMTLRQVRPSVFLGVDTTGESWTVGFVGAPEEPADLAVVQLDVCSRMAGPPPTYSPAPEELRLCVGDYSGHGKRVRLSLQGGTLLMEGFDDLGLPLRPLAARRYVTRRGTVECEGEPAGPASALVVRGAMRFVRVE